jgi:hypothetical protein
MRRTTVALTAALCLPAVALPAVAAATGSPRGPAYRAPDAPVVKVIRGVATADATTAGVQLAISGRGWKGPWGAPLTVTFGQSTRFAGQATKAEDIDKGDRVQVVVLVPRRPTRAPLPAAETVVDQGPARTTPAGAPWLGKPRWFLIGGPVTAVAGDSVTVKARVANRTARGAIRRAGTRFVTVRVDATTRIRERGVGRIPLSEVVVGDRVRVTWRAPRWTPLADLPAARRIQVR